MGLKKTYVQKKIMHAKNVFMKKKVVVAGYSKAHKPSGTPHTDS
jgi:hypothetical protein